MYKTSGFISKSLEYTLRKNVESGRSTQTSAYTWRERSEKGPQNAYLQRIVERKLPTIDAKKSEFSKIMVSPNPQSNGVHQTCTSCSSFTNW